MRYFDVKGLPAEPIHQALLDSGFVPLVDVNVKMAMHFVRKGRHVVVRYDNFADMPLSKLKVVDVLFADFLQLQSGEIIII